MDIKSYFAEKLSGLLFLEVEKKNVEKIFEASLPENIYLPVNTKYIVDNVKLKKNMDEIPVGYFIEGMYYVLGADENFKFAGKYKNILKSSQDNNKFIKGVIAKNIKDKNYEDAYIILKGLSILEDTVEIYDKLIIMADEIRKKNHVYREEELNILEKAELKEDYALPYFYESILKRESGDYERALFCINTYIEKGGEETLEVTDLKQWLISIVNYDRGKELLENDPVDPLKALKLLIPLMDTWGDNALLYYYIAIAYRMLENYEKAIYYLNEALNIDSSIVEIVNEMGINYASLGKYETAVAYLRKAFEVTKSVEICTNLVMCYLNSGDLKNAKIHIQIAKKIDPKDEVVVQLENMVKNMPDLK
ncbi:tetratricopeptide repeat protein [Clostridium luticellarii]|uniref:Tetratricopeptide repeat protein n=1 Tax=Clostridium luticellarii TaxID=1691940 RepID=A0A2T0BQX9_9CLOT|nr:tetratricopeptide repeat protein [Clostridium luticellarii]PRR86277.1 Tetratricopeptide repeat protein [Clostridium luticellarii]